jgi:hypothetical protein
MRTLVWVSGDLGRYGWQCGKSIAESGWGCRRLARIQVCARRGSGLPPPHHPSLSLRTAPFSEGEPDRQGPSDIQRSPLLPPSLQRPLARSSVRSGPPRLSAGRMRSLRCAHLHCPTYRGLAALKRQSTFRSFWVRRSAKMVKRVGVLEETAIANVKKMIESHKPELQAAFEKRDPEKRGWYVSTRQRSRRCVGAVRRHGNLLRPHAVAVRHGGKGEGGGAECCRTPICC